MNNLVSIIIPAYNAERYLDRCLQSIIDQTYSNIEIIIVNDNSKDNSKDIILSYMKKYTNIILIDNKENLGVSQSRNKALDIAKGKYIAFVDSDDWIENNMIEIMYIEAERSNADVVICDVFFTYDDGRKEKFKINWNNGDILDSENAIKELLTHRNNLQGYSWNKFYKKEVLDKNNIRFPQNIKLYEDIILNLEIFKNSKKIKYINEYLYNYYQRDGSATRMLKLDVNCLDDVCLVIKLAEKIVASDENINVYRNEFNSFSHRLLTQELIKVLNTDDELDLKVYLINSIFKNKNNKEYIMKAKYKSIPNQYKNMYLIGKILELTNFRGEKFVKKYFTLKKIKNLMR